MFDFLKKTAQVLLNNPQDPMESFRRNCGFVCDTVKSGADDDYRLREALDAIARALQSEVHSGSCNFLDYLTENGIMEKVADLITSNIRQSHAQLLVLFFAQFFSRELHHYLHQMTVHTAITKVISKLVMLNWKCEKEVRFFVRQLYTRIAEDPITFELLAERKDADRTFPIIGFLVETCTSMKPSGTLARDFIEKMFFQETEMAKSYGLFVKQALYPVLRKLFMDVSQFVETIDFGGSSVIVVLEWCDRLFQFGQDFDIGQVYKELDQSLTAKKKLQAMAFWLDHLVRSEKIRAATLAFCISDKLVQQIVDACESSREDLNCAAFDLLLLLLNFESARAVLLPPFCSESVDVITALPESWQASAERPFEKFSKDIVQLNSDRPCGANAQLYSALLGIYRRYGSLGTHTCFQLTKTLSLFYAWAPDLINQELHDATRMAMSALRDVESQEARNLISFVRSAHTKFISALKNC